MLCLPLVTNWASDADKAHKFREKVFSFSAKLFRLVLSIHLL